MVTVRLSSIHTLSILLLLAALMLLGSCTMSDDDLKNELTTILSENPAPITDAIKDNPVIFSEAIQNAITLSRAQFEKKRRLQEREDFYQSFEHPMNPNLRTDDAVRGNPKADLTLVEYVDFECPFCARAYGTIQDLERQYEGNIRVYIKHLPLSFHEKAMPAARYFEALRLQKSSYAIFFYHKIFERQQELRNGDIFLKEIATASGADMNRLKNDLIHNEVIDQRIKEDIQEAQKFRINGTPGFILSGIPIRGAYPLEHFVKVINELKKRQMAEMAQKNF